MSDTGVYVKEHSADACTTAVDTNTGEYPSSCE